MPLIGEVPTASALLFDIGVFALVIGATMLMLIALARQSVRGHRAAAPRVPAAAVPAAGAQASSAPTAAAPTAATGDD